MRKKMLSLFLVGLLSVSLLSGCGVPSTSKGTNTTTPAVQDENKATEDQTNVVTDEPIVLRVVDWSDSTAERRKIFNEKYMELHPNITIEYTTMTIDQFKSSVVTAINSGEAPDLFPIPVGINLPTAVAQDWFLPLNDLTPPEFWDTIIEPAKGEGVTQLNGKYYALPEVQAVTVDLMYYNQDVLDKAGVTELPKTFSEFVNVCDQVSKAGNGDYYGLIEGGKQINRMYSLIKSFANVGGAKLPDFTKALVDGGRINYDSQAVLDAFGVFKTLRDNGSIHPDSINLSAPEAREYFAQGQAAFLMQGIWCIGVWESTHPETNFGTMAVPVPDSGQKGLISIPEYAAWMGVYSQTKHPKEAAEYLMAMYNYGNDEYVYQNDLVAYGGQMSAVKGVVEASLTNERVLNYFNLGLDTAGSYPSATIRDSAAFDFYNQVVDVQPSIGNIFQGVISGGMDDYKDALTTLSDQQTAEWKRAAEAAGTSLDVFDFSNWDPMKTYTTDDYKALK